MSEIVRTSVYDANSTQKALSPEVKAHLRVRAAYDTKTMPTFQSKNRYPPHVQEVCGIDQSTDRTIVSVNLLGRRSVTHYPENPIESHTQVGSIGVLRFTDGSYELRENDQTPLRLLREALSGNGSKINQQEIDYYKYRTFREKFDLLVACAVTFSATLASEPLSQSEKLEDVYQNFDFMGPYGVTAIAALSLYGMVMHAKSNMIRKAMRIVQESGDQEEEHTGYSVKFISRKKYNMIFEKKKGSSNGAYIISLLEKSSNPDDVWLAIKPDVEELSSLEQIYESDYEISQRFREREKKYGTASIDDKATHDLLAKHQKRIGVIRDLISEKAIIENQRHEISVIRNELEEVIGYSIDNGCPLIASRLRDVAARLCLDLENQMPISAPTLSHAKNLKSRLKELVEYCREDAIDYFDTVLPQILQVK